MRYKELSRRDFWRLRCSATCLIPNVPKLWFQFAAEKVLFFLESLEIGTDETIRIMPCVMMYQNKRTIQTRGDYSEKDFF